MIIATFSWQLPVVIYRYDDRFDVGRPLVGSIAEGGQQAGGQPGCGATCSAKGRQWRLGQVVIGMHAWVAGFCLLARAGI